MRIDRVSEEQLCITFREAFSDYLVDASYMTEEKIRVRAAKNNVDFDLSVGAFDDDRMVGFTLIGVDDWNGEQAAFDAASGIVPGARGQGLVKRMFDHAVPALRARGVSLFLLEVLQNNHPAIRAYTKSGFKITREFACFELELASVSAPPRVDNSFSFQPVGRDTVATFSAHVDWEPSWENSFGAIHRIPGDLLMFGAFTGGECGGTIVYAPQFNWIMTLIVKRRYRRRGAGSGLVRHLAACLPAAGAAAPLPVCLPDRTSTVRMLNVLASDTGMLEFLSRLGFRRWVDQYEMACRI